MATIVTSSQRDLIRLVTEEIFNGGDLARADALFTDDYVNHGGIIPDLLHGPEAIKLTAALYRRAFPTFQLAVVDITADEAAIVIRWVARMRPGHPGNRTDGRDGLRGLTRCRLRGEMIAESWTAWDRRVGLVRYGAANGTEALNRFAAVGGVTGENPRTWLSGGQTRN